MIENSELLAALIDGTKAGILQWQSKPVSVMFGFPEPPKEQMTSVYYTTYAGRNLMVYLIVPVVTFQTLTPSSTGSASSARPELALADEKLRIEHVFDLDNRDQAQLWRLIKMIERLKMDVDTYLDSFLDHLRKQAK